MRKERGDRRDKYYHCRIIKGLGICGLRPQFYNVAIFIGIDEYGGYKHRICYPDLCEAKAALKEITDPNEPPGFWIKRISSGTEVRNKEYMKAVGWIGEP